MRVMQMLNNNSAAPNQHERALKTKSKVASIKTIL